MNDHWNLLESVLLSIVVRFEPCRPQTGSTFQRESNRRALRHIIPASRHCTLATLGLESLYVVTTLDDWAVDVYTCPTKHCCWPLFPPVQREHKEYILCIMTLCLSPFPCLTFDDGGQRNLHVTIGNTPNDWRGFAWWFAVTRILGIHSICYHDPSRRCDKSLYTRENLLCHGHLLDGLVPCYAVITPHNITTLRPFRLKSRNTTCYWDK